MPERLGRSREDADYGMGEVELDLNELGLLSASELTERLVQTFESPNYKPPRLPVVATQLLALAQDPDVEFSAIEALLEQDAMLAGEVLSVARSAFYSRSRQVDSLHAALVLLGLRKLQEVVMQAAMNLRVFRSASYADKMEQLRLHCRATAHIARFVSMYTPFDEEQAFLCGLLHDVGFAGILLVLGDVARGETPPDLEELWPAIDAAHVKAGERMVELWGLPPEIAMTIGAHHQVKIQGYEHPLAATICVAEALSTEFDLAFTPSSRGSTEKKPLTDSGFLVQGAVDQTNAPTLDAALGALALTPDSLGLIRDDARAWAEAEAEKALA